MRIKHIDALRGIAAVLVTFFHLTGNSGLSMDSAPYGKYGYLGVEIFFVISGFILPYSMYKTGYDLNNFGRFILRRIIRIYPAYIITIIIGILLPLLTGRTVVSWLTISAHLVFLNSILGYDWISPVFWTLAIEFQFYMLIGLLFAFFSASNIKSLILIFLITGCSLVFSSPAYIFHWFPFFALGILIYNRRFTNLSSATFWLSAFVLIILIVYKFGIPETIAGCFAFLFIMFIKMEHNTRLNKVMLWLGAISYSLYLVHWELGRLFVVVSRHMPLLGKSEIFRISIGMCFAVFFAYILYRLIERPSIKYSSKIKYQK